MNILLINGPNLNLLGEREPGIYGTTTLADIESTLTAHASTMGAHVDCCQTNHEGEAIDRIHAARGVTQAIIINPAAWTHTSVALLDALNAFDGMIVEVHLSNVHKREAFRHHSYVSGRADGVIAGLGPFGYEAALEFVMRTLGTGDNP